MLLLSCHKFTFEHLLGNLCAYEYLSILLFRYSLSASLPKRKIITADIITHYSCFGKCFFSLQKRPAFYRSKQRPDTQEENPLSLSKVSSCRRNAPFSPLRSRAHEIRESLPVTAVSHAWKFVVISKGISPNCFSI